MIQITSQPLRGTANSPRWHRAFLAMMPTIVAYASIAFRGLLPEAREEAIQEVVANALAAYARLVERRKTDVAHPTVLARYAIAQVREGRRVGTKQNRRDVLSSCAHRSKDYRVERLDYFDEDEGEWREAVVEDRQTPVADQAAFRIDFPAWLANLSRCDRRIAERLAIGRSTKDVARKFGLTSGRISQKRREYAASWHAFHGEPTCVS